MKKDRNAFFSEYGFNSGMPGASPNMMMPGGMQNPNMTPYPGANNMQMPAAPPMPTDIDARIAKLERQIGRLETRVGKLEGELTNPTQFNETEINYNNSMYMV